MNKYKLGAIIILIVLIVSGAIYAIVQRRSYPPVYIAVMVPETARETTTKRAVTSIQMYLNTINEQGGLNGHPLKLVIVDDGAATDTAIQAMENVAKSNQAMVILGHAYSDLAIAIGPSLEKYKIPAIAAGATAPEVTLDNNWFFRVVPNNTTQGQSIAVYALKVLEYKSALIVYEDNKYGTSLSDGFESTFQLLGGTVLKKESIRSGSESLQQDVATIIGLTQDRD